MIFYEPLSLGITTTPIPVPRSSRNQVQVVSEDGSSQKAGGSGHVFFTTQQWVKIHVGNVSWSENWVKIFPGRFYTDFCVFSLEETPRFLMFRPTGTQRLGDFMGTTWRNTINLRDDTPSMAKHRLFDQQSGIQNQPEWGDDLVGYHIYIYDMIWYDMIWYDIYIYKYHIYIYTYLGDNWWQWYTKVTPIYGYDWGDTLPPKVTPNGWIGWFLGLTFGCWVPWVPYSKQEWWDMMGIASKDSGYSLQMCGT